MKYDIVSVFFIILLMVKCHKERPTEKDKWLKILKINKTQLNKVEQELKRKFKIIELEELKWIDDDLPEEIRNYPRILFGKSRNPFIQKK